MIPDAVQFEIRAKKIRVKGPRGILTRDFKHLNLDLKIIVEEGVKKLIVESWFGSRKTTASIRTTLSHVKNLVNGVTKGFKYKMRFVYAHFPINASITDAKDGIEIRNFLGEKKVILFQGLRKTPEPFSLIIRNTGDESHGMSVLIQETQESLGFKVDDGGQSTCFPRNDVNRYPNVSMRTNVFYSMVAGARVHNVENSGIIK